MSPAGPAFPVIPTADLGPSLAFWADGLGFAETFRFPPEGEAAFSGLSVEDVDAATAAPAAAGAPVLRPSADEPWGERLAHVADPDGTPVMLVAPLS